MEIFQISMILFSLCLFLSPLTETHGMCKGNLPPIRYVALNSNVTVPCPTLESASEMVFKLYKGPHEVTCITYIKGNNTLDNKHNNLANFGINFADNSAYFILFSVTINTTALYTCEAIRHFPPPLVKIEQTPQTVVFVEEIPRNQLCQHDNYLVLWVVLGGMIIYGLVMPCMVLKLKNIKFRGCRQKWQGVQHPTRQGVYIDTVA